MHKNKKTIKEYYDQLYAYSFDNLDEKDKVLKDTNY